MDFQKAGPAGRCEDLGFLFLWSNNDGQKTCLDYNNRTNMTKKLCMLLYLVSQWIGTWLLLHEKAMLFTPKYRSVAPSDSFKPLLGQWVRVTSERPQNLAEARYSASDPFKIQESSNIPAHSLMSCCGDDRMFFFFSFYLVGRQNQQESRVFGGNNQFYPKNCCYVWAKEYSRNTLSLDIRVSGASSISVLSRF